MQPVYVKPIAKFPALRKFFLSIFGREWLLERPYVRVTKAGEVYNPKNPVMYTVEEVSADHVTILK